MGAWGGWTIMSHLICIYTDYTDSPLSFKVWYQYDLP